MPQFRCTYEKKEYNGKKLPKLPGKREVSVVIPTYNEQELIGKLIDAISKQLKGRDFEIIVVDDNSKDKTPEILDKYSKKGRVVGLHRKGIKGILSATVDGCRIARGRYLVLLDADFSHPPEKIPEMLSHLPKYDFVSGSRFIKGANIIAPFSRKYSTTCLNALLPFILGLKQKDLTGVFHAIKKDVLMQCLPRYKSIWGEFDMEIFYYANKKGYRIKEVPFTYDYRKEGNSKAQILLLYGWVYMKRAVTLRLFH